MTFFWLTVAVLSIFLLLDYVYRRVVSGRISRLIENIPLFGAVSAADCAADLTFNVSVADGEEIAACLFRASGKPRGLIIFCPELNGSRWTAVHYGSALRDAGFSLLSFDFRNQGDSTHNGGPRPTPWVTDAELADLSAVIRYVLADDDLKDLPLGVFGVSRGGSAALLAACRYPQIQSVVTDSAYSTRALIYHFMLKFCRFVVPEWLFRRLPEWHNKIVINQALQHSGQRRGQSYLHLEQLVHNLTQPVLLVSGSRDSFVTPDVTKQLAGLVNQEDNVWVVPRAKHNKARSVARSEYDQRLIQHFERTLVARSGASDSEPSRETPSRNNPVRTNSPESRVA